MLIPDRLPAWHWDPYQPCPCCHEQRYEPGYGCHACGRRDDGDDGASMTTDEAEFDDEGEQEEE